MNENRMHEKKNNIKDYEIVRGLYRFTCTLQINLDKYDKQKQMNITGTISIPHQRKSYT